MAQVTQDNVLLDLSYLLGETSVPTNGIDDRKRFIQAALQQVYRLYPFEPSKVTATVVLTNGVGTMPSDIAQDGYMDIRYQQAGTQNDNIFTKVTYEDFDNYGDGDHAYWLDGYAGNLTLRTSDTSTPAVTVHYETVAPTINASIATPFPSSMALARGALVYLRAAQDPQADVAQEMDLFMREVQLVINHADRNKPRRSVRTRHDVNGSYIGKN